MKHCAPRNPVCFGSFSKCFTICLFISPDFRRVKGKYDMFTICLFISPDLDGSRALKTSLRH
jgi:hypothetical protein